MTRILTIDCSSKWLGWCCDREDANRPSYDLIKLPGPQNVGKLYCAVRNSLSDLVEEFRPQVMGWCPAFFRNDRPNLLALGGVVATAELVCWDNRVRPMTEYESTVCAKVLGCGVFGERDAKGKIIKGTGTPLKKAAALRWCAENGFETDSDDVADAVILHEHFRRQLAQRPARAALPY